MGKIGCCLLFLLIGVYNTEAQYLDEIDLSSQDERVSFKEVRPAVFQDFKRLVTFPGRMKLEQGLLLAGFVTVNAGLMLTIDGKVSNSIQSYGPPNSVPALDFAATPGKIYDKIGPDLFILGASGIISTGGFLFNNPKMAKTGLTAIEAFFFTNLTTNLLKFSFGRNRPYVTTKSLHFNPVDFDNTTPQRSMPSGHTSRIFAFSTVLASSYDKLYVKLPAYSLAASVALQRISSSKHWVSDVVVGGALGYVMGRFFARQNNLIRRNSRSISTHFSANGIGLNIKF